ncbi:MAG TPA: hypothetical protein VNV38_01720 [Stellaceae bacterium]|jgi:hypothetical protein|nr:hypothetical protein [Stellaceae bacterium]
MMNSHIIAALLKKRRLIAGEIVQLEKQIAALGDDLVHLEATIRVFQPDIELPPLRPTRIQHRHRHFKGGFLTRLVLDYIREHPGDVFTIDALMPAAIGDRQLSAHEVGRLRITVYQTLYRVERHGEIKRIEPDGRTVRWKAAGEA